MYLMATRKNPTATNKNPAYKLFIWKNYNLMSETCPVYVQYIYNFRFHLLPIRSLIPATPWVFARGECFLRLTIVTARWTGSLHGGVTELAVGPQCVCEESRPRSLPQLPLPSAPLPPTPVTSVSPSHLLQLIWALAHKCITLEGLRALKLESWLLR